MPCKGATDQIWRGGNAALAHDADAPRVPRGNPWDTKRHHWGVPGVPMSAPKCSNFAPPGNRPRHTPQPNQCDLNDTTTSTQRRFVFNQLWSGHCLLSRPYGCTSRTDSNCAIDCTMSDRTSPTTVKASLKEQPHPSFNAECAYGPYELWPTSHHCAYGPYEL